MPAKPSLDSFKKAQVCGVLSIGGSILTAARAVGCHPSTIYATAKRDPEFHEQLATSRAGHEATLLNRIHTAAQEPQFWRAAAWALERMYPERYRARPNDTITLPMVLQFADQLLSLVADEIGRTKSFDRIADGATREFKLLTASMEDAIDAPSLLPSECDDTQRETNERS